MTGPENPGSASPDPEPLPPAPEPETPDVPAIPYDERFVVTRDSAPVTFGHVLHNDGVADASVIGVRDADGNFYSLADLAAMNGGLGLETEFGWLRVDGDKLVFEAKPGVDASAVEVVTYVARNNETGEEYTQNVQIRFSDDDNDFSSGETVDTYYSQNTAEHEMADIALGGGHDRIIVNGKHADDTAKTINAGDGNNYVELDSGDESNANRHAGLTVSTGSGNDTVIMNGRGQSTGHSSVSIDSGAGRDSIRITAQDASSVYGDSSLSVKTGKGEDAITVNVGQLAKENAGVTVLGGSGQDDIGLYSRYVMAENGSSVTVNAEGGENKVSLESGDRIAANNSKVTVTSGDDKDIIKLSSGQGMAENHSEVAINAGAGANKITLDADTRIAGDNSKVSVTAGDGADSIELNSGGHMAASLPTALWADQFEMFLVVLE